MSTRTINNWRIWLRGLVGAVIGGGANAICVMVVAPDQFNFELGWAKLWHFTLISSVVSAALFLKQSPVPPEEEQVVDTVVPFPPQKPPSA